MQLYGKEHLDPRSVTCSTKENDKQFWTCLELKCHQILYDASILKLYPTDILFSFMTNNQQMADIKSYLYKTKLKHKLLNVTSEFRHHNIIMHSIKKDIKFVIF